MKKLLLPLAVLLSCSTGCTSEHHFALQEDNDYFTLRNNDRDYTEGWRLSDTVNDETGSNSKYIQQTVYTPGHKSLPAPLPGDRSYAGWLSVGFNKTYIDSDYQQTTLGIDAGIVGPHAYGEQVQDSFHNLIGQGHPKGWDTQLHDEPALLLTAERRYRVPITSYIDLISLGGANLGNVFTQGYLGQMLRVGYNLPVDLHAGEPFFPRVTSNLSDSKKWSIYGFIQPVGRLVLQDIFYDGNTFRDSITVNKETFVAEGRVGIAIEYKKYRLGFTYCTLTKEYKTQDNNTQFGEVTFGRDF